MQKLAAAAQPAGLDRAPIWSGYKREGDLNKASELQYGTLPGLEKQNKAEEERLASGSASKLIKDEVGEEDIAEVVSRWTGVPVSRLLEGEKEKLLHLDDELHRRVIGCRMKR